MKKIVILSIFILALLAVNISFAAEQPEMSVSVADIEEGSTAHVSINLPSDATGKVTVSVNGQSYVATVAGGQASVDLPGLKAGDYNVKVTYEGSGNYSKVVKQANLKVAGEAKSNDTEVDTNVSDNTSINASGEPASKVNTTVLDNLTNNTNSSNSTNDTNKSNITPKKTTNNTAPAKKPKQPKKPLASLSNKNTGLPILILMLVSVGAIFATVFRKQ
jgi:hypothetical protein